MIKTVTFEGTTPSGLYDMTMELNSGNLILMNSKVITEPIAPSTTAPYESISLQIGGVVNSFNTIDNDPNNFLFKHKLKNIPELDNAGSYTGRFMSDYEPQVGITMGGSLNKVVTFSLRDSSGNQLDPTILKYFFFQFQYISTS